MKIKLDTKTTVKIVKYTAIAAMPLVANSAFAFTLPSDGDPFYDLYDIAVVEGLEGAPGAVGGIGGIVFAATKLSENWKAATLGILACSMAMNASSVLTTLGMVL